MTKDYEIEKIQELIKEHYSKAMEIHTLGSGAAYGRVLFWIEQGVPVKDLVVLIRKSLDHNLPLKEETEAMFYNLKQQKKEDDHIKQSLKEAYEEGDDTK